MSLNAQGEKLDSENFNGPCVLLFCSKESGIYGGYCAVLGSGQGTVDWPHVLDMSTRLRARASSRSCCSWRRSFLMRSSSFLLSRLAHSSCSTSFPNYDRARDRERGLGWRVQRNTVHTQQCNTHAYTATDGSSDGGQKKIII